MKNYFNTILFTAFITVAVSSCYVSHSAQTYSDDQYVQAPEISMSVFVNELGPYGRWMDYPGYGNVWICNEPGFRPYYSGGHWIYTNYGWTWASDYRWGWAPFHYGRWAFDPAYGWFWVPGYEWAPAWVNWGMSGDNYGWTPMAPGMSVGVNISFGSVPPERWCFVPSKYMGHPHINNYYIDKSRNVTIIKNTTIINNTNVYNNARFNAGPNRGDVERFSGKRINPVQVRDAGKINDVRYDKNTINVYRPRVIRNANDNIPSNQNNGRNVNPAYPQQNNRVPQNQPANRGGNGRNVYPPQQATNPQVQQPVQQQSPANTQNNNRQNVDPANNNNRVIRQQPVQQQPPANTQNNNRQNTNPTNSNNGRVIRQQPVPPPVQQQPPAHKPTTQPVQNNNGNSNQRTPQKQVHPVNPAPKQQGRVIRPEQDKPKEQNKP